LASGATQEPPRPIVVSATGAERATLGAAVGAVLPKTPIFIGSSVHDATVPADDGYDFDGFGAQPPPGWPAKLAAVWYDSLTLCRKLIGGPPWSGPQLAAAQDCSARVGQFLWQKYLDEKGVDTVLELYALKTSGGFTLVGATYGRESHDVVYVLKTVATENLAAEAKAAVTALVAGQGERRQRAVIRSLGTVVDEPFDGIAPIAEPVGHKQQCDDLPATLLVTPDSVFSRTLASRWAASVKGSGTEACQLIMLDLTEADQVEPNYGGLRHDRSQVYGSQLIASLKCQHARSTSHAGYNKKPKAGDLGSLSMGAVTSLQLQLCAE
jgi:hypothetical protein